MLNPLDLHKPPYFFQNSNHFLVPVTQNFFACESASDVWADNVGNVSSKLAFPVDVADQSGGEVTKGIVVFCAVGGSAVYETSPGLRCYVGCGDYRQRLRRGGEDWLVSRANETSAFKFADNL